MAATSCENRRTQAYSSDLRWRMIYQALVLNKSSREIAQNLNVDQSTVSRTVKLFNEEGHINKKSYPANEGTKKLTQIDELFILELVIDRPGIYLHELQQAILEETGPMHYLPIFEEIWLYKAENGYCCKAEV